jgi:hypothetical protein
VARTEGTEVRQRAHWSLSSGHFRARKLTDGGTIERGEHGEPSSGLTGARAMVWQPGNDREMAVERSSGTAVLGLWERRRVRWGRCGELRGQ